MVSGASSLEILSRQKSGEKNFWDAGPENCLEKEEMQGEFFQSFIHPGHTDVY